MDMSNFQQAIEIITTAQQIWSKQYPDELYPKISKSYYLLGNIYLRKGENLSEAKQNFERALEINLKLNQEIFQDTADIYHLIGKIYAEEKNKELFEQYFQKALDISDKINGKTHSFKGIVYNHLGQAYQSLNMDYEAKDCFERAIEVYIDTCGPLHLNLAITYKKCAECNIKLKLTRSALSNYQNARRIYLEKYDSTWLGIEEIEKAIKALEKKIED